MFYEYTSYFVFTYISLYISYPIYVIITHHIEYFVIPLLVLIIIKHNHCIYTIYACKYEDRLFIYTYNLFFTIYT